MHGGPHSIVLVDFSAHTYWYLTATGELMTLAAGKLESIAEGEPS